MAIKESERFRFWESVETIITKLHLYKLNEIDAGGTIADEPKWKLVCSFGLTLKMKLREFWEYLLMDRQDTKAFIFFKILVHFS